MNEQEEIKRERWKLLMRLQRFLDWPFSLFGFVWLVLIIVDLTKGLIPDFKK